MSMSAYIRRCVLLRVFHIFPYKPFFFNINLFIYFWLRWVFVAVCGLSLVAASGGYSLLRCVDFSLQWLLLLRAWALGTWAQ